MSLTLSITPIRMNIYIWTRPEDPEMQLVCHWFRLDDRNLTLCLKTPISYFELESNDFHNDIVRRAIDLAVETQSRGIYISTTSILLPCHIDAACIPPDEALSVDYTPPPDTPSPPIFQLSAMKMIYMPGFAGAVSVVEVDKSQLVYKRLVLTSEADKDVKLERRRCDILQCELDVYSRLHRSPYVLPIIGLVERVRHFVVYDDPHTKDVPVTDGFLIPFVGIFSQWCLGFHTEWTVQEKEFLALTLMDALLDFEQRGVHITDLKNTNILLTKEGLKIIDLDLQTHTPGYARWGGVECSDAVRALYNMAMAISELFLSGTTYVVLCEGAVPQSSLQLIEWCKEDAFGSIAEMMAKTGEMLAPVRARVKNMSASALAEARLSRCKALAKSEDEWWLGRAYNSDLGKCYSWVPRYFELSIDEFDRYQTV